jgi:hypothetical protein
MSFLGFRSTVISIREIRRFYPDEWVAVAVIEIDDDGFASKGQILAHAPDERFVWLATKLGDGENPVYIFYTGARHASA